MGNPSLPCYSSMFHPRVYSSLLPRGRNCSNITSSIFLVFFLVCEFRFYAVGSTLAFASRKTRFHPVSPGWRPFFSCTPIPRRPASCASPRAIPPDRWYSPQESSGVGSAQRLWAAPGTCRESRQLWKQTAGAQHSNGGKKRRGVASELWRRAFEGQGGD